MMALLNKVTILVALITALICSVQCLLQRNNNDNSTTRIRYRQWQQQYHRGGGLGGSNNQDSRYQYFQQNCQQVDDFDRPRRRHFRVGLNQFADMSYQEFTKNYLGYKGQDIVLPPVSSSSQPSPLLSRGRYRNSSSYTRGLTNRYYPVTDSSTSVPSSLDWRSFGAVTPVEHQGTCGCCWAFSATGALEGAYKIKYGTLVNLSEQNLMDCSWSYGNQACDGGWMTKAFQYAHDNGGINSETYYPFDGAHRNQCRRSSSMQTFAPLAAYSYAVPVARGDERALMAAVAKGPVSVAIDASLWTFRMYVSGVYSDAACNGYKLKHAVLLVGYGTDGSTGEDYWIIKNSWGPSWGENGYMRIARGSNVCSIASDAVFPVLA